MSSADYTTLHTLPLSQLRSFARNPHNQRLLRAYLVRVWPLVQAGVWRALAAI